MTREQALRLQSGDMIGTAEWNRYASCGATLSNPVKVLAVKRGQHSQTGTMLLVSGYADWIDAGWFEAPAAAVDAPK